MGLVSKLGVSSPIVRSGRIVGFFDGWIGNRLYPVDMAGFAVNIQTLKQAADRLGRLEMPYRVSYEEDGFLRQVGVAPGEGEPLAENCSLVLVWHTQTFSTTRQRHRMDRSRLSNTNIPGLLKTL